MEHNAFGTGPNSFEKSSDSDEDSSSSNKKSKKKDVGALLTRSEVGDRPAKTERDLSKSIDRLPLIERPKESSSEKAESQETADETPLETISDHEKQEITKQIAEDHQQDMEQADEQTVEQLEPAIEFLDRVADGDDVEEAFAAVAAEIGLSEEEVAEVLAQDTNTEESEETDAQETPEEAAESDAGEFDTSDDAEGYVPLNSAGSGSKSSSNGGSSGSGSGGSGTGGSSGGSGGGGGTVGTPPPTGGGAAGPNPFSGGTPAPGGFTVSANQLPNNANVYYSNRNKAGELLLIGIVGYLIGRRRGRLRTEKKLLPVQRKLQKQVTALEQDITHKEQQLVALKAARQPERRHAVAAPSPVERAQPSRQETRLHLQKPVRAERLGHMVVAAEAPSKVIEKTKLEKPNSIRQAFRAEEVKDMRRADLLELSEKIKVEGASLRHIYESRLIGEKQLRHLVSEYLHGKDIRNDLRKEMIEHEIDFERDPILRDRVRSMITSDNSGTGLGALLTKAGITNDEESDPTVKHRVEQAERKAAEAEKRQKRQRIVADVSMVTVIAVLIAIVALLLLWH